MEISWTYFHQVEDVSIRTDAVVSNVRIDTSTNAANQRILSALINI